MADSDDKMQRMMEFLLEQQAHLTATVSAIAEAQQRAEKRWERTEESIRALLTIAEIHEEEITENREAIRKLQERVAESQERTDRQLAETGERLNAFINFFERYLSNGRGGEKGGDDR
ncbi:MAG TPA: hypothetical protein VGV38_18665 [Pyrinomonadaceae bacterium]|nr:hypothetical protein [Pyrinomonadaceae bacterium]